jgi:peptidoglycan/xylan/chitin deacetylase (PgdA/CDA1 family)
MRNVLKRLAFFLLGSPIRASFRIRKIGSHNYLTILNLHRVHSDDGSAYKPLEPRLFEDLLRFLQKHFVLTTFAELEGLQAARAGSKPFLILSFDDGYKDFIEVTVPVLDKFKIRVNQNLIPECVDSGQPPLNVAVQDFIGRAPKDALKRLVIPGFDMGENFDDRVMLGFRISKHIKYQPMHEQNKLKSVVMAQIGTSEHMRFTPMMTLWDIKQCLSVHEFGAHSFSHASMEAESDEYFTEDLSACKRWFDEKLNLPVHIYAFPNGSYKEHQIAMVREAGFKHILLVDDRFSKAKTDLHPRFGFNAESRSEMRFRAVGGFCRI